MTKTARSTSVQIPSVQIPCPAKGCLVFPFASYAELTDHLLTADHLYEISGPTGNVELVAAARRSFTDVDASLAHGHRVVRSTETVEEFHWAKRNGEWLVTGPAAEVDATITITKKSGETAEAVVVRVVEPGLYEVRKANAAPAASATGLDLTTIPSGRYAVPGGDTRLKVQIDNVDKGKWAGWVFVKDGAEYGQARRYGRQKPGETYKGDIVEALTAIAADPKAAAAAYGHLTGNCGICGAHLEQKDSVERGIGPICAAKFGGA